jgi:hypothetical protein
LLSESRATAGDEGEARIQPPKDKDDEPKGPHRELALFPIVGGSTDIGVQIGVGGVWSQVSPKVQPYVWKIDFLTSASFKSGPRGPEVVQQSHDVRFDVPKLLGGTLRLAPAMYFERTVNAGYFGVGNATVAQTRPDGTYGDRYQYVHQELRSRLNARSPLSGNFDILYGLTFRGVSPEAYAGSKLEEDARTLDVKGGPVARGLGNLGHGSVSVGVLYDTRNDEIVPTRGDLHLLSMRLGAALPGSSDVRYGNLNMILRHYEPLGGPFVFASRLVVDAGFGNFAFYDLSQGGAFPPVDMPGGPQGVRGVPNGRYSGLLKAVANAELRAMWGSFRLLGDDFKIGNNIFADTGRVFADYTFSNPKDGRGLGLAWGLGAGAYLLWGSAALVRVEFAYSPDAVAANPGFPIGIYAQDSQMF